MEPNERPAAAPDWGTANPHLASPRPPAWSPPPGSEPGPAPAGYGAQAPWASPIPYAPAPPPRRNGIAGYVAYRRGKKTQNATVRWTGIALMIYPYAVSNTWLMWAVGLALCCIAYAHWE